jgi:hypothetical protein
VLGVAFNDMRLSGLVHSSAVTGGEDVYIELRDLSVLLGANDSAKTRSLIALHEGLRGLTRGAEVEAAPLHSPPFVATVFVELTDEPRKSARSRWASLRAAWKSPGSVRSVAAHFMVRSATCWANST